MNNIELLYRLNFHKKRDISRAYPTRVH